MIIRCEPIDQGVYLRVQTNRQVARIEFIEIAEAIAVQGSIPMEIEPRQSKRRRQTMESVCRRWRADLN